MTPCIFDAGEGGDDCEVFSATNIVARKHHTCCECGDTIAPGDRYELVKGLWNGKWDTYRTCAICSTIRQDFLCSWIYGGLDEALTECLDLELGDGVRTRRNAT